MILHLITHAHTAVDAASDATTWSLSAVGRQQAAALAREPLWDAVDVVAVSSEPKTRLTAAPALVGRDLPLVVDERLDELRRPTWLETPERYRERVAAAFTALDQPAGDWEPVAAALSRVRAAIDDLAARYPDHTGALVGHGLTLSLYRAHLLGQPQPLVSDWQRLDFAAVARADVGRGRWLTDFRPVDAALRVTRGEISPGEEATASR